MNGNHVIEMDGLSKRYDDIVAVDHLDMRVRRGEVYGFLGPNGAGKTTTLRMLLGLIRPTSGDAVVLGAAPGSSESLRQVGAMIETPAFYPHLSGRDNLRVVAMYAGVPETRVGPALEQVELADRAHDTFRSYSLGMKQRLGVAAALLKDPALLILDEPTNGLDPAGMAEMRSLIRRLGHGDRTVLLSSHLMTEVEQICDRVGVIAKGRLVAEGTVDELRGEDTLLVRVDPLEKGSRIVAEMAGVQRVVVRDGTLRISAGSNLGFDPAYLNQRLNAEGIAVRELRWDRASLESVFLSLTGSDHQSHGVNGQSDTIHVTETTKEAAHVR